MLAFKESQSGARLDDVHSTLDASKGSRRQEGVLAWAAPSNLSAGVEVADPVSGVEGKTYTHEGGVFRLHNVVNQTFRKVHRANNADDAETWADGEVANTLNGHESSGVRATVAVVTHALTHEGHDASEDGTGRGTPLVVTGAVSSKWAKGTGGPAGDEAYNLTTEVAPTVNGTQRQQVDGAMAVQVGRPRRLTPTECERLMGWPDGWTDIPNEKGKPASDSARYKAIGNGCVSHVAEWIGRELLWRMYHDTTR